MDEESLRHILNAVRDGSIGVEECLTRLRAMPYEDLGFARIDTHRAIRTGFAETIYCPGKTPEHVAQIFERLAERHPRVLATRATEAQAIETLQRVPGAQFNAAARALYIRPATDSPGRAGIALITAGTADLPVAEEAVLTASLLGHDVLRIHDVGVAGLHRLLHVLPTLQQARVLIVVAGMEGALPSVVAGLVRCPVIAVPTSTGYGASFGGLAALLAMLNSCAEGVAVVNIDNGFGAARFAAQINDLGGPLAEPG